MRNFLTAGATRPPRETALEIVGRINRETGRREGGIVGLTSGQTDAVIRARMELSDPDTMGNYFTRKRRDARFDKIVREALKSGKPVAKADADKIIGRYKDRLLAYRGETIARNEALAAMNAAKQEGIMQMIDSGKVPASAVTKVWSATGDARTRDSHMALNGKEIGIYEAFVTPQGHRMLHPHDTTLGAPGSETIQCRCFFQVKIDYIGMLGR